MPETSPDHATDQSTEQAEYRGEAMAVRGLIGGGLMGLANLVPGISGGTMLLAAGVYPQFINGVAEVSTFRFRPRSLLILACIVGGAIAAIVGFAGPISGLVIDHRWVMYSIFIGLTLGGVPILMSMLKPIDPLVVGIAIIGIAIMAAMATLAPSTGGGADDGSHPYLLHVVAGLAGASAMVLPGISGGYLLLILGEYVVILTAVAMLKDGVAEGDWSRIIESLHTVVPVGLGVVAGVVGVSNLIKMLLARFERATLGMLLGLLLGAVIGLWPFQEGVPPEIGASFRGDTVVESDGVLVMEQTGRVIEPKHWSTAFFRPSPVQCLGAIGLVAAGFAASMGVSHLGGRRGAKNGVAASDSEQSG